LINHGIKSEEEVELAGTNAKMNEFQAVMGLCNLKHVDTKIKQREELYFHYKERLSGLNIQFQKLISSRYNYIYMPVIFESLGQRDYFQDKNLVDKYHLNVASYIANCVLCLPLYADLEMATTDVIIDIIKKTIKRSEW
jgi:dTDP-4-amino-4,6-dideoxygalactose transaminase